MVGCCRYELERQLLDGKVTVKELPALWNRRMTEYLGCTPKNDAEGILQVWPPPCPAQWVPCCEGYVENARPQRMITGHTTLVSTLGVTAAKVDWSMGPA